MRKSKKVFASVVMAAALTVGVGTGASDPPGWPNELPPAIPQSTGTIYYVATTGSDSNAGTEAAPWLTIQKAFNTLTAGQRAYVRAGTYAKSLVMTRAGTSTAPITVQAYPGEHPVIRPGGSGSMDYPVRITAGAAWFRMSGFIIENAPLDDTVNLWVSDGGQPLPNAAHDIEISYNEIRNSVGTGLFVSPKTDNVQLIGNIVYGNGTGTAHQHQGIYVQGQNGLISNNIVFDQPHGFGIQVRGQGSLHSVNQIVVNNTSVGNQLAGFVVENTADYVKIVNNISAFNGTYGIHAYNAGGAVGPGNEAYNNLLYGNPSGATRVNGTIIDFSGGNMTTVDPLFVNLSGDNYHLQTTSPALGQSLYDFTPFRDADNVFRPVGSAPDIGAYES